MPARRGDPASCRHAATLHVRRTLTVRGTNSTLGRDVVLEDDTGIEVTGIRDSLRHRADISRGAMPRPSALAKEKAQTPEERRASPRRPNCEEATVDVAPKEREVGSSASTRKRA
jgi:hypothetical protein